MTRRLDLLHAVKDGKGLQQIAEELALAVTDADESASGKAAAARELRMVLAAMNANNPAEQGDKVDELAARRKARRRSG